MQDVKRYMRLAKRDAIAKSLSQLEQRRKGVVKDLYVTTEEGSRLHHRIIGETSSLVIKPTNRNFDIVENASPMRCFIQDKLYKEEGTPMQQLRLLEARMGTYRFRSYEFAVQEAALSLIRMQGTDLPTEAPMPPPFLHGKAAAVSFVLTGKIPQFTAQQFMATLDAP